MAKIVVLDAGHNNNGIDTGAQGNGLREQDITLDIALRTKPLLEANGITVIMTRTGERVPGDYTDVTGSLRARVDMANNAKADLFVAIHVNAGGGTGFEVWVVGRGGNAEKAANSVLSQIISVTGWTNRGVKTANDYVLKYTDMPAILTENGFIDTTTDAAKLKDLNFLQKLAVAHAKGILAYFGMSYKEPQSVLASPASTPVNNLTAKDPIMGQSKVSAGQMATFLLAQNSTPQIGGMNLYAFCRIYLEEGAAEGVRGDVAFCQSIKETGWFKFSGQVTPEQFNYAGIGSLNDGRQGAQFKDQREGIRAQIQHLKAYASKDALSNPVVDPRFSLVTRRIAPNWQDLAGRWAVPGFDKSKYTDLGAAYVAGETYGQQIVAIYNKLVATENSTKEGEEQSVDEGILIFGPDDFPTANRLAASLGNEVAIFMRKADGTIPAVIKTAKHLYVIGGAQTGVNHPNQTVLAGANWFATVAAVGKKLGQL